MQRYFLNFLKYEKVKNKHAKFFNFFKICNDNTSTICALKPPFTILKSENQKF